MSGPYPRGGDHGSGRRAGRGPGASGWLAAGIIVGIVGLAATVYVALDRPTHSSAPLLGLTRSSTPAPSGASARLGGPTASLRTAAMPADHLPATAGAAPCTGVRVLASLENADVLRALARGYAGAKRNVAGRCVTVSVTADKSGLAEADAAKGFPSLPAAQRPTVWAPDSSAWLTLARVDGAAAHSGLTAGRSLAESAIVLAMPAELAEAIGWSLKAPTWAQIFATAADADVWAKRGHPEWGGFKLGKTSPQVATSGLLGMAASYGVAAGGLQALSTANLRSADIETKVHAAELSVTHYMATPEHFLWHVRQAEDSGAAAEFLSAVIVDEKSVWDYNRGLSSRDGITEELLEPPAQPLLPIYPSDGTFIADSPAAVLSAPWSSAAQRAASADFIAYTTTKQGQAVVRANGYHDVRGQADTAVTLTGRYTGPVAGLHLPSAGVLSGIVHEFPAVRKRARVLFLLDVSGSMADQIAPGLTKLTAAKQAMVAALAHFTADDQVGLAAFSNQTGGPIVPGVVAPVAPLRTARPGLLKAVASLQPIAQTPLFAAVQQNTLAMAQHWQPDVINAVVLLSDGHNDTDIAGSLPSLTAGIEHLHHQTPVLVFTLAYGKDADVPTLQAIARMTGAHFYDATDPATIERVLGDLVTSF
jgi:Ca-activated chloride channel family protein